MQCDFRYDFKTKIKDDISLWVEDIGDLQIDLLWREILTTQSITKFLCDLDRDFSVELLYFGQKNERIFGIQNPLFREVYLKLGEQKVVYARSICDKDSIFWRDTLNCKLKPLGEILFSKHISLKREPFLYAKFDNSPARFSSFSHKGEDMYLYEYFLPDLKSYLTCPSP